MSVGHYGFSIEKSQEKRDSVSIFYVVECKYRRSWGFVRIPEADSCRVDRNPIQSSHELYGI
jgi:hypothetical protein